jgi:hypothetical protein
MTVALVNAMRASVSERGWADAVCAATARAMARTVKPSAAAILGTWRV